MLGGFLKKGRKKDKASRVLNICVSEEVETCYHSHLYNKTPVGGGAVLP